MLMAAAACSPGGGNQPAAEPTPAAVATAAVIPASSPDAKAARDTVEQYFKLVRAKDYDGAYKLWADKGAATGGSAADFAKTFEAYSIYEPKTGEQTEIHVRDGKQFVLVTATLYVKNKRNGATADRSGTVMLRRSADRTVTDPDQRDWRIWGTDIRLRHQGDNQ